MKKPWLLLAGIALLGVGAIIMVKTNSTTPAVPTHEHQLAEAPVQPVAPVAQTMPAQLPCYCHCDRGMGHKSLHSCFEDDHAASCATCINEALLARKLEKEQKLSPAQIRD